MATRRGLALRVADTLDGVVTNLARVGAVELRGNYRLQREHVLELAGLRGGRRPWAWELTPREIRRRLLQNAWIESVQVESSILPYALRLQIVEAEPWMIAEYEKQLIAFVDSKYPQIFETLRTKKQLDDEAKKTLEKALKEFGTGFGGKGEKKSEKAAEKTEKKSKKDD